MGKFRDSLNMLGRLTPRRTWNALKVINSYLFSRLTRRAQHFGMPISIAVEPTTSCNLRCPECPSGLRSFSRPTGMLDSATFRGIINELHRDLLYLTFYFQGEPYLHPDFLNLVRLAREKKIYTATSTNAHYLTDQRARETVQSGLDRLIISIDGTTQETYQSYRVGGNLVKVIDGAKNVVRWKKKLGSSTPHLIFQFLVVRPNEHQVSEVKALASEIGVDEVRLKTAQIYDFEHGSPLIPSEDRYSRYQEQQDGTWKIKNKLLDHCWKMWNSCVITWDGKIVPCCFDKDAHFTLGTFGENNFRETWHGPAYRNFRSSLIKGRDQVEMCRNCTEGTAIWA